MVRCEVRSCKRLGCAGRLKDELEVTSDTTVAEACKATTRLKTAKAIARQQLLGHYGIGDYMHAKKW